MTQKRVSSEIQALKNAGKAKQRPPQAPDHLTEDQAEVWERSFAHLDADWITPEQFPIAEDYCRLVCISRVIAGLVANHEAFEVKDGEWLKSYNTLTRMQRENATAIHSCATKLCITNKSTISPKTPKNAKMAKVKPHEFKGDAVSK